MCAFPYAFATLFCFVYVQMQFLWHLHVRQLATRHSIGWCTLADWNYSHHWTEILSHIITIRSKRAREWAKMEDTIRISEFASGKAMMNSIIMPTTVCLLDFALKRVQVWSPLFETGLLIYIHKCVCMPLIWQHSPSTSSLIAHFSLAHYNAFRYQLLSCQRNYHFNAR